jgi:hypothetical protein
LGALSYFFWPNKFHLLQQQHLNKAPKSILVDNDRGTQASEGQLARLRRTDGTPTWRGELKLARPRGGVELVRLEQSGAELVRRAGRSSYDGEAGQSSRSLTVGWTSTSSFAPSAALSSSNAKSSVEMLFPVSSRWWWGIAASRSEGRDGTRR